MKMIIKIFVIIGFVFCIPPSYAWYAKGHQIIAQIAYQHLKPRTKRKVNHLIKVFRKFDYRDRTFIKAAGWADLLRYDDVNAFNHWHYINLPFSVKVGTPLPTLESKNIVWAISQCEQVLLSSKSSDFEKAFFLRLLIHLIGDIHQPLHCATRVTSRFPKGDMGGQLFSVKWSKNITNLHVLWDSGVGLFEKNYKYEQVSCTQITQSCDVSADSCQQMNWARESFNIAKNFAYQTKEGKRPNAEYVKKAQNIVKKRLALAGCRLACVLNNVVK